LNVNTTAVIAATKVGLIGMLTVATFATVSTNQVLPLQRS